MADQATVAAVGRMAIDLKVGNRSMVDLVRFSGYLTETGAVTEEELGHLFQESPDLIRSWVIYSSDQRTTDGYYLLPPGNGSNGGRDWLVGHYPEGVDEHFADGTRACAKFVKLEAEEIRRNIRLHVYNDHKPIQ